tara:strand:+ start:237 stop:635 length:399 start_codon:yes stop_codon:yes gene_type:complete
MYLDWSEKYKVDVPMFDEQHKVLFSLVNILYIGMKDGKGKAVLENLFKALRWYTEVHFQDEEAELSAKKYPDYEYHRKQHVELINKVNEFHKDFKEGKNILNVEFITFLVDWLQNHIGVEDKKYGEYLNSKG